MAQRAFLLYCGEDYVADNNRLARKTTAAVRLAQQRAGLLVTGTVNRNLGRAAGPELPHCARRMSDGTASDLRCLRKQGVHLCQPERKRPHALQHRHHPAVREFRANRPARTLWTTIAAMEAWNLTRRKYGKGIPVGYAFRRIWEGGHGTRSQHYAGVAFDVGQSLPQRQRTAIYNAARLPAPGAMWNR